MASRAKAVLLSEVARKLAAWCGGSLVWADAAEQGPEGASGEFSRLVGVGSGDPIPLSGCGLSPLCRWQQAAGEPDSLWDE
jgi:hypothetical protein